MKHIGIFLCILLTVKGSILSAQEPRTSELNSLDPVSSYNAGVESFQSKDWNESLQLFSEALESSDLKIHQDAYYNKGLVFYEMAKEAMTQQSPEAKSFLEESSKAFQNTIDLNPASEDARANKEAVDQLLEQLENQEEQSQESSDQEQENNQDESKEEDNSSNDSQSSEKDSEQSQSEDHNEGDQSSGDEEEQRESNAEQGEGNDEGEEQDASKSETSDSQDQGSEDTSAEQNEGEENAEKQSAQEEEKAEDEPQSQPGQEVSAMSEEEIKKEEAERLLRSIEQGSQQISLREFLEGKSRQPRRPEKDW